MFLISKDLQIYYPIKLNVISKFNLEIQCFFKGLTLFDHGLKFRLKIIFFQILFEIQFLSSNLITNNFKYFQDCLDSISYQRKKKKSQSVPLIQKDKVIYLQYNYYPKKMGIPKTKSKKYAKISEKRRNDLITLVTEKNYSIPKAALVLKLSPSTAKNIIKIYKQEGRVMNKKMSRRQKPKMSKSMSSDLQQVQKLSENQQQQIKIQKQHEETNYDPSSFRLFYNYFYVIPVYPISVEMFPSVNLTLL